jgi:type II secretory pathway pseudopilin PulG
MRRHRGFTLIEMSVIVVVLMLFAALIVPNVIKMGPAQQQRAIYGALVDLVRKAREDAIENGTTYALAYDGSKSAFVLKKQPASPDQTASSTGNLPQPENRPLSNVQSVSDLEDVTSLVLPAGIQANTFRVGTEGTDPGSWLLHFYPDGTSEGGGVELTPGGNVFKSVEVTKNGIPSLVDGPLPDPSEEKWTAGTYAQQG